VILSFCKDKKTNGDFPCSSSSNPDDDRYESLLHHRRPARSHGEPTNPQPPATKTHAILPHI
jgi:hypothetical protein